MKRIKFTDESRSISNIVDISDREFEFLAYRIKNSHRVFPKYVKCSSNIIYIKDSYRDLFVICNMLNKFRFQ